MRPNLAAFSLRCSWVCFLISSSRVGHSPSWESARQQPAFQDQAGSRARAHWLLSRIVHSGQHGKSQWLCVSPQVPFVRPFLQRVLRTQESVGAVIREERSVIRAVPCGDPSHCPPALDTLWAPFLRLPSCAAVAPPPRPSSALSMPHVWRAVCAFVCEVFIIWILYISFLTPKDRLESRSQVDQASEFLLSISMCLCSDGRSPRGRDSAALA